MHKEISMPKVVQIPIKFIYDPNGIDRILCIDKMGVDILELIEA